MMISVIIPTYNRCDFLNNALHSVLQQTRTANEIIVIDDGSNDNTASMMRTDFSQITYIQQPHQGVSAARNTGIQAATGNWLAFLDSDDCWSAQKLAEQEHALRLAPELKICHTEEIWIRNGTRVNAMNKHKKTGGWIFQHCLPLCVISPSSVMIHRSVLEDVGGFDENLPACEDYDLWLRISAHYPVLFLAQPLIYKYGGHKDQLSQQHWGMDRFRIQALHKIIKDPQLSNENRRAAQHMLIKKAEIFIKGAEKRHNHDAVAFYSALIQCIKSESPQ